MSEKSEQRKRLRKRLRRQKLYRSPLEAGHAAARVMLDGPEPVARLAVRGLTKEALQRFIAEGCRGVYLDGYFDQLERRWYSSLAALRQFLRERDARDAERRKAGAP